MLRVACDVGWASYFNKFSSAFIEMWAFDRVARHTTPHTTVTDKIPGHTHTYIYTYRFTSRKSGRRPWFWQMISLSQIVACVRAGASVCDSWNLKSVSSFLHKTQKQNWKRCAPLFSSAICFFPAVIPVFCVDCCLHHLIFLIGLNAKTKIVRTPPGDGERENGEWNEYNGLFYTRV